MFDIYSSVQLLEKEAAQLRDFFNAYLLAYILTIKGCVRVSVSHVLSFDHF